ncbi:hypothetical protein ID866_5485 [Astraeus odoratus]|nr:hypothetical protein ID866_5485 [Astraeus odoratus]
MNFSVNDNPVLVAPRPVRVTPVYPPFPRTAHFRLTSIAHDPERLVIQEDNENCEESRLPSRIHSSASTDKESCSSRQSPLSSLPSEALEEFLSILRPAIFPPTSPILRPRRNPAVSLPTFGVPYRSRTKLDITQPKGDQRANSADDNDTENRTAACSPEALGENLAANLDNHSSEVTCRWHAQVLGSPVSRMHTRNSFPHYASQEAALSRIIPSRASPAIPLPLPSPDELLEAF